MTRRQHDDATVEVERLDLSRLQQAVFHGVARSKQDRGALRVRLVGNGVRREMQDVVGPRSRDFNAFSEALSPMSASTPPTCRSIARLSFARVRKPAESKALEERGVS